VRRFQCHTVRMNTTQTCAGEMFVAQFNS
jgi:hypothetical protein